MEHKIFDDMPSEPEAPRISRYLPDLMNGHGNWICQWMTENPKILSVVAISTIVLIFGIGAYVYREALMEMNSVVQDKIMELSSEARDMSIQAKESITDFADTLKTKVADFIEDKIPHETVDEPQ